MASVILGGNPVETLGDLPKIGSIAPDFKLVAVNLSKQNMADYKGSNLILNIFPSIDTATCAQSVREFNKEAAGMNNTKVLCISRDLPFAQARFCGAEGIENVVMLSDFKDGNFGKAYGLEFKTGAFEGLHSRCIIVLDQNGVVKYTEQVQDTSNEPNYKAALKTL
ncbi:MAG: thiol peroxidase [Bacteroidetes bacterium]|nr:MAG: thiol peroxidase [Bacteroidota bacterium]